MSFSTPNAQYPNHSASRVSSDSVETTNLAAMDSVGGRSSSRVRLSLGPQTSTAAATSTPGSSSKASPGSISTPASSDRPKRNIVVKEPRFSDTQVRIKISATSSSTTREMTSKLTGWQSTPPSKLRSNGEINEGDLPPQNIPSGPRSKEKPSFSYASMIGQAILASDKRKLSLVEIYNWISAAYPFYKVGERGWMNSIRHNLSLNKSFQKVERDEGGPQGKGMLWAVVKGAENHFENGRYRKPRSEVDSDDDSDDWREVAPAFYPGTNIPTPKGYKLPSKKYFLGTTVTMPKDKRGPRPQNPVSGRKPTPPPDEEPAPAPTGKQKQQPLQSETLKSPPATVSAAVNKSNKRKGGPGGKHRRSRGAKLETESDEDSLIDAESEEDDQEAAPPASKRRKSTGLPAPTQASAVGGRATRTKIVVIQNTKKEPVSVDPRKDEVKMTVSTTTATASTSRRSNIATSKMEDKKRESDVTATSVEAEEEVKKFKTSAAASVATESVASTPSNTTEGGSIAWKTNPRLRTSPVPVPSYLDRSANPHRPPAGRARGSGLSISKGYGSSVRSSLAGDDDEDEQEIKSEFGAAPGSGESSFGGAFMISSSVDPTPDSKRGSARSRRKGNGDGNTDGTWRPLSPPLSASPSYNHSLRSIGPAGMDVDMGDDGDEMEFSSQYAASLLMKAREGSF